MSIAARFDEALDAVADPDLQGPELLPDLLARAAVRLLGVDGAGLSLRDPEGRRVPLGASSPEAACVERLQFTVGAGPCMTAQETGQPVFAELEDLHRRWPPFAERLVARSRFRGVVALPLAEALSGTGAMDLYFERGDAVPQLDVFEAIAVGHLTTSALSEAAVWSTWTAEEGPEWVRGPSARRRAAVWEAIGAVSIRLDVDSPTALALLRAAAWSAGREVDEVAADVLTGRLDPADLDGATTAAPPRDPRG